MSLFLRILHNPKKKTQYTNENIFILTNLSGHFI